MAKSVALKGSKADKVNKKEKKVVESSSDSSSSSSSDSSDSDSSDSEDEKEEKKAASSSSDSDSDSDSEPKKEVKKTAAKASSDSDSSDSDDEKKEKKDSSDSDSSSDSDDSDSDDEKEDSSDKKRKATEEPAVAKKPKTEAAAAAPADGGASTTVFVGGLSWNVDNDWLRTEFTECGEIVDVRVITDRDSQRSKGYAYVEFATAEGAQAALALAGKDIDGRAIRVDLSEGRQKKEKTFNNTPQGEASDTLFIGNLSFNATEEEVRGAFAECGEIISVRLPTDRETGQPKGFGYIQFGSVEEAKAAIAWNGSELSGRPCRLDFAGKKPERSEGGGGGFGGGFGGGRGGGRGGPRGGRGGPRGGGRGGPRGGRGGNGSTNRGGFGSFQGSKVTF